MCYEFRFIGLLDHFISNEKKAKIGNFSKNRQSGFDQSGAMVSDFKNYGKCV